MIICCFSVVYITKFGQNKQSKLLWIISKRMIVNCLLRIMQSNLCSSGSTHSQAKKRRGMLLEAASDMTERSSQQDSPGRAAGRLESHFGVPHSNPEVSAGESIEVHAWLGAEWEGEMNAVCKRRENWGGEVWSCLYTQMRLLETGWLEIGHDQFHHLGRGGDVC